MTSKALVHQQAIEIPLEWLCPSGNIPAGLNALVVMAIAHTLRNAADGGYGPCRTAPIHVRRDGHGRYTILDGRHRWVAHWIAGLKVAACIVELNEDDPAP